LPTLARLEGTHENTHPFGSSLGLSIVSGTGDKSSVSERNDTKDIDAVNTRDLTHLSDQDSMPSSVLQHRRLQEQQEQEAAVIEVISYKHSLSILKKATHLWRNLYFRKRKVEGIKDTRALLLKRKAFESFQINLWRTARFRSLQERQLMALGKRAMYAWTQYTQWSVTSSLVTYSA
jgi:hypothetical protein